MDTCKILERLIAVDIDSEKRFRHAAGDVERANFEHFLNQQAEQRHRFVRELQAVQEGLGFKSTDSGTLAGFIDREALDLSVAMSKGDTGVLEWCRRDDEEIIGEYEKALDEKPPAELRNLIERQLHDIRAAVITESDVLRLFGGPHS
ncbi:MAG TPA: PA2169 family four-helix-bundle protein [Candidatus Binataceae bacterium]|nr:PA2169 family four-helix-bundle protein [Candidatus Binataceae bacterium]